MDVNLNCYHEIEFTFFEFKPNLVEGVIYYLHIYRNNIYANNLHIFV